MKRNRMGSFGFKVSPPIAKDNKIRRKSRMDFTNLKNFMDHLTQWRIPGNSITVYKNNKVVYMYQSGYSNLEKHIPMAGGELFYIYSCSKPLTVTAALQLYEKGSFLLDDPLYELIPEFRHVSVVEGERLVPAKTPITMRHLFTMTAGLDYDLNAEWKSIAKQKTNGKMNTVETIRCLAEKPLLFHPGEQWNYSLCHDVLAAVVEVISGQKFRDYVQKNIFDVLDMKTARYHADAQTQSQMAEQYRYLSAEDTSDLVQLQMQNPINEKDPGRVINVGKNNSLIFGEEYDSGGAGIITSVEDYAKFANAMANGGVGATGEKILSSGTIDLLRTDQIKGLNCDFKKFCFTGHGYGLGVKTMNDRAQSGSNGSIGEFGWGGAAGATIHMDPQQNLAYFYAHHMLNPQESYYQPRLRNVIYSCL